MPTIVEELASIGRHGFGRYPAATRASDGRRKFNRHWKSFINDGSSSGQAAEHATMKDAAVSNTKVERAGGSQTDPTAQARLRRKCIAHAIATASAATIESGVCQGMSFAMVLMPMPTPRLANAKGKTQHAAAAVKPPKPANAPSVANSLSRYIRAAYHPIDANSLTGGGRESKVRSLGEPDTDRAPLAFLMCIFAIIGPSKFQCRLPFFCQSAALFPLLESPRRLRIVHRPKAAPF